MRKKLDTRFPAARIKKIMQTDEDIGKIAMAVPLLVSKALELFLQDLCDRTYEITLQRGAKTLNSLHLKQCVQSFNMFDFLREIVNKVPDLGGSDAAGDERSANKRRKIADDDHHDSDDESKRGRLQEIIHANGSGRGRGRGRSRGRGRPSKADREAATMMSASSSEKHETDLKILHNDINIIKPNLEVVDSKDNHLTAQPKTDDSASVHNFDLNLDLDENGDTPAVSMAHVSPVSSFAKPTREMKPEEYPGWSIADVDKMAIDPIKLASQVDDEEEDYDEE